MKTYVFYSDLRKSRGVEPYFVKSTNGTIIWGNLKQAQFFESIESLVSYLIENRDKRYDYKPNHNNSEFWINWISNVGRMVFHHPLNVPE